jgi:hypothetical protein
LVVTLSVPKVQDFSGKKLAEALAWCLVWLMATENGAALGVSSGTLFAGAY